MLPICCTNRHQCPSQALPVQLVLQHWAGGTTPALGATILTALRKAKTTQWERYGTLGTKNGKFLQDHRKRSHCTDVFQFKRSREQESKAGERQALKRLTYQQIMPLLQISAFPESISARLVIFLHSANSFNYRKVLA